VGLVVPCCYPSLAFFSRPTKYAVPVYVVRRDPALIVTEPFPFHVQTIKLSKKKFWLWKVDQRYLDKLLGKQLSLVRWDHCLQF